MEGQPFRRFYELALIRNESPALALSWTLFHILDEQSPLYGLEADALAAANVSLVWWWCPGTMLLQRNPSTPRNPMSIRGFALTTATPRFLAPRRMAGSGVGYGMFHQTIPS